MAVRTPALVEVCVRAFGREIKRTTGSGPGDLVGHVVAVLLRPEDPPREPIVPFAERLGAVCPEQAVDGRVAIGDVEPGDLVVAVVVEPGGAAERRVDGRR